MLVRCTECGREERPDHATSLSRGWPMCCGYTMRLESTKEFIAAIEKNGLPAECISSAPEGESDG
jgi:hypothetical protein